MTHPDIAARERARWFRCNAHLWVRPYAARFLAPGAELHAAYPALATKYSPSQPRVPAGSGRESGRWTDGGGGIGQLALPMGNIGITDPRIVSDADADSVLPGEQYANVIRVCIASGISRSKDQWGNQSYTVTYDCADGRSFTKSGFGNRIRGIVLDPFR